MSQKEKSLDELVEKVRESTMLTEFISMRDFETKVKKIARKYGGNDKIEQKGSHKAIRVGAKRIGWSLRQKGHESVLSPGVFNESIQSISEATGIPYEELELYFKGSGKIYKRFKRDFEQKYLI